MILILNILDFENRMHTKFKFNWSISFQDINFKININRPIQARIQRGARGPGPPLSDHTTIIKFSGPVLKYFLHTFSTV